MGLLCCMIVVAVGRFEFMYFISMTDVDYSIKSTLASKYHLDKFHCDKFNFETLPIQFLSSCISLKGGPGDASHPPSRATFVIESSQVSLS